MAEHEYEFDNGEAVVPCVLVAKHDDGTADLFASEGDSSAVKLFRSIPEGEGGITYKKSA